MYIISEMDVVRGAIASAMAEGMTLEDFWACSEHAEEVMDLDYAVNILAQTIQTGVMPPKTCATVQIVIK